MRRRQLQALVRLRTDGVAEVLQPAPALEGHSPQLPPHRLDDAGWTDARSSMRCTVLGAPHTYRIWVTDFDGENLRGGSRAEAVASGVATFKQLLLLPSCAA